MIRTMRKRRYLPSILMFSIKGGELKISYIVTVEAMMLIFCLYSCASNPSISSLRPEQRARLNTIIILKGGVDRPYKVLGTVKGLSCHRNAYQKQLLTEDEALEGVRLKAALLDADAVINTACQVNSGTDWVNNCWSSIVSVSQELNPDLSV